MTNTNKRSPSVSAILADIRRVSRKLKGRAPTKAEYLAHGKHREWELRKLELSFTEAIRRAGFDPIELQLKKFETENARLRGALDDALQDQLSSSVLRELIGLTNEHEFGESPDWLKGSQAPCRRETIGIPTLFLSDIHFDEVVRPEQIEGVNEYNHEIAVRRLKHTFRTAIELTKNHMVKPNYDGFVLALGGDLLSGNIHEELAETNEQKILKSVIDLTEILIVGVGNLADEFGKVFVPCVVGNHGRLHKKPRAKFRVQDNFEWLVYQYLRREFRNDSRVAFLIPESADAHFSLYGTNLLLTHGDQFKGGAGISGIFAPLMTGMSRKQKRQQSVRRPFDIMMMGHWHQYIHASGLIINGSVKGYDEYAYVSNFGFEPPQQALFITHPSRGITFRMPVLCDPAQKDEQAARSKISW